MLWVISASVSIWVCGSWSITLVWSLKMVDFLSRGGIGAVLRWCSGCCGFFDFCFRFDECRVVCVLSGRTLVSWCRWLVDVSDVHPVAIRSAAF